MGSADLITMNDHAAIIRPAIEESWLNLLRNEFSASYFSELKSFLISENRTGKVVFPPGDLIFNALNSTPFHKVKVVIIGQDPYHGTGQANGLCFSVADGVPIPPSLKNIFKEIREDLNQETPLSGNLQKWADQGVLLLNATLTVESGRAGSHQNKGWEKFTDTIICKLSDNRSGIVFLLWGKFAQAKEALISSKNHFILKAPHPSPFSAHTGFLGCRHFSKANALLLQSGQDPIDWTL
jgi:uracil-DNA glycosylase